MSLCGGTSPQAAITSGNFNGDAVARHTWNSGSLQNKFFGGFVFFFEIRISSTEKLNVTNFFPPKKIMEKNFGHLPTGANFCVHGIERRTPLCSILEL